MPIFVRPDADLYYEEYGSGFPVLLLAPGGMRSSTVCWRAGSNGSANPYCNWPDALASKFRVIAMDQRNAGQSRGDLTADHGWHTFAADQLALMDHLGCDRFHVIGASIGASFALKLIETAAERVTAAVLQNHIGYSEDYPTLFQDRYAEWADELTKTRPDVSTEALAVFGKNMWQGDFVFSVSPEAIARMDMRVINMPGDDAAHPFDAGNEVDGLMPNSFCLPEWKCPANELMQRVMVIETLKEHN